MFKIFKKKNPDEQEDLSIIADYKEPFTWSNFWKKYVTNPIKNVHDYLQKNGVLFFLLSPFQYRNRLILKIVIIIFGIFVGIVPRSISMIHELRERNLASEIASTQSVSVGEITVNPLDGGYDAATKTHMLAFNIVGDSNNGVPSVDSGYSVSITPASGITSTKGMHFRYKVLPVSQTSRLMIIAITGQLPSGANGVYHLDIHARNTTKMTTPMNIVLSANQKASNLYQNGKINLAALSDSLTSNVVQSTTAISDAQKQVETDINNYNVNEQRLNASGMTIGITTEKLKAIVKQQIAMPNLTDKSTTADLANINPKQPQQPQLTSSITYRGKTYKTESQSDNNQSDQSDTANNNPAKNTELPNLASLIGNIETDIGNLNSARVDKYNALVGVEGVLNMQLTLDKMTKPVAINKD